MNIEIKIHEVENLKYADLQKLAKSVGIKANRKCDKLRQCLREYALKHANTSQADSPELSEDEVTSAMEMSEDDDEIVLQPKIKHTSPATLPVKTPEVLKNGARFFQTPKMSPLVSKQSPCTTVTENGTPANENQALITPDATPQSERRSSRRLSDMARSPTILAMKESMKEGMTDQELKNSLLSTLEKSVSEKMGAERTAAVEKNSSNASHIPRFAAFVMKKKAQAAQNTTPGSARWEKAHAKSFRTMDSIDDYLDKKRKRNESLQASQKKTKLVTDQARNALDALKKCRTPPVSALKKEVKPVKSRGVLFKPSVTSVSKISTDFTTLKTTPAVPNVTIRNLSKSVCKENRPLKPTDAGRKSLGGTSRKSLGVVSHPASPMMAPPVSRKSIGGKSTPFKFNANSANTTLTNSAAKKKFDLNASLARPKPKYKAHSGKLPAWGTDPKNVKVSSKEDRRQRMRESQNKQRQAMQMKNRQITS